MAYHATERTERRGMEWTCDNCSYINRDTDIECRMCGYAIAPWKQKLIALWVRLSKDQAAGEVSDRSEDQSKSQWVCSICTVINDAASMQCGTCETPRIADRRRNSSSTSASDTTSRTHLAAESPFQDAANPAQKVIGRIRQLVKKRLGTGTPELKWSLVDNAGARWTCSRCQFENNIYKMDCERCGFEDTTPTVKFSPW